MKTLKNLIWVGLLGIAFTPLAAQDHIAEKSEMRARKIQEFLELNEQQSQQMREIHQSFAENLKAKMEEGRNNPDNRAEIREAIQALKSEKDQKVADVLTEEQWQKYQAARQKMQQRKQQRRKKGTRKFLNQNPDLKAELQLYRDENIHPRVRAQRLKLEEKLSASEKQSIAQTRAQLQGFKEDAKGLRKELKSLRESGEKPSEAQINQLQDLKARRKASLEGLKSIAQAHESDLKNLWAELEEDRQQWKADIQAIIQKYVPEDAVGKGRGAANPMKKLFAIPRFLLMDGASLAPGESPDLQLENYPNPGRQNQTLRYTLGQAGNVKISLLDQEGRLVKVLEDGFQHAGSHELKLDGLSLNPGVYFYRIETPNKVESKRWIVK